MSNDDFNLSYYKDKGFTNFESMSKNNKDQLTRNSKIIDHIVIEETDSCNSLDHIHPAQQQQPQQQITHAPAIDFKLDVKIEINSGKCILHASKNKQQDAPDRYSFSSYYDPGKAKGIDPDVSINTNFIFPAIKVKAFYESTHKQVETRLVKKANLYTMIRIESLIMPQFSSNLSTKELISSRDMCISPALLDFLEQTLEPFDMIRSSFETASSITTPVYSPFNKAPSEKRDTLFNKKGGTDPKQSSDPKELPKSEAAVYFPIEVVVFVSMLPSSIRFTCQPQSTMECMLKLPTLELVFSTYKLESNKQDKLYSRMSDSMTASAGKDIFS